MLAPLAEQLGLRLRIAFEHLAAEVVDDPEPFEPDADDLVAIGEELRHEVEAIRAEATFAGVGDPDVCHRCRYRSICPDSAAAGGTDVAGRRARRLGRPITRLTSASPAPATTTSKS